MFLTMLRSGSIEARMQTSGQRGYFFDEVKRSEASHEEKNVSAMPTGRSGSINWEISHGTARGAVI